MPIDERGVNMTTNVIATIDVLLAEKLEHAATIARTSKSAIIRRALQIYLMDPAGQQPPAWDQEALQAAAGTLPERTPR